MTNLSNATHQEMQAFEAKLELSNRIYLRQKLNHLMIQPNVDIADIMALLKMINEMVELALKKQKQDHADEKGLSRDRELTLAESRVSVQRESQALARAKLESKQMPPEKVTPSPRPAASSQPHSEQSALSKADTDGNRSPSNLTPIHNTVGSTTVPGTQNLAKTGL